ncbi:MAG: class I SAM-dependent methyltransferase [Chloroflexota bacterium]|nr:class I SAM-dependent methyltransferase [Chloroflexota bacterium]
MMQSKGLNWVSSVYYWLAERLYNELAFIYDPVSWVVSLGQWSAVRNLALDYLVGSQVLEIGFGTGELLIEMASRNYVPCGLDISEAMMRITQRKLNRKGIRIPVVRVGTHQMPFASGSFDSIVSTFPAGYLFDPATWMEVARLLRGSVTENGGHCGRFIVVGIGASPSAESKGLTQLIPSLPLDEMVERCKHLAQTNNLKLRVETKLIKGSSIPVIIAEKTTILSGGSVGDPTRDA